MKRASRGRESTHRWALASSNRAWPLYSMKGNRKIISHQKTLVSTGAPDVHGGEATPEGWFHVSSGRKLSPSYQETDHDGEVFSSRTRNQHAFYFQRSISFSTCLEAQYVCHGFWCTCGLSIRLVGDQNGSQRLCSVEKFSRLAQHLSFASLFLPNHTFQKYLLLYVWRGLINQNGLETPRWPELIPRTKVKQE